MDRDPFRPVHAGCLEDVRGLSCLDQHLGLVGEAIGLRQSGLAVRQCQPASAAIFVESGDMERALVEEVGGALTLDIGARRNELVDVLEALVVAHVDDHALIARQGDESAFVLDAPECRALDRHRIRSHGIDLDHPAEAVGLVRVTFRVKAFVVFMPAVAGGPGGDSVTLLFRGRLLGRLEIAVEIFLAGEVGAPRRHAHGAIVQGSEDQATQGIRGGAHALRAGGRAGNHHRGGGGDATRVGGGADDAPGFSLATNLDHRDTVRRLCLGDLPGVP